MRENQEDIERFGQQKIMKTIKWVNGLQTCWNHVKFNERFGRSWIPWESKNEKLWRGIAKVDKQDAKNETWFQHVSPVQDTRKQTNILTTGPRAEEPWGTNLNTAKRIN